jgi:hypothetical protein
MESTIETENCPSHLLLLYAVAPLNTTSLDKTFTIMIVTMAPKAPHQGGFPPFTPTPLVTMGHS